MIDISLPLSSVQVHEPPSLVPQKYRELLTPLSESGEYLLVIDNSSIETFTTCPTYAMYHLVYAREAHARNAALTFGGAVHVGMECIELGIDEVETAQKVLRYFTE